MPKITPLLMRYLASLLAALLITLGCNRSPEHIPESYASDEWHAFQGTWIASGTRQTIGLGRDRRASIAQLSGSLVLSGEARPDVGFLADAIVLNDTSTGTIGRAVWTDERGDRIYSELKGETTSTGSKLSGTFIGGSGRYSNAIGSYQFSWRFVLDTEDGHVQGQSEGLTGQIWLGTRAPSSSEGGTR